MNTYLKNCTINMHVFLSDEVLRLKSMNIALGMALRMLLISKSKYYF